MTWQMWLKQIRAVVRLEMKKTFFSRRGLWVYLLALLPVLLFAGRAIDLMRSHDSFDSSVAQHAISKAALESIQPGASIEEVEQKLGEPYQRRTVGGRRHSEDFLLYTDGSSIYTFVFTDGELRRTSIHERGNFQDDSLVYATFFQFFYLRLLIFFGCVGIFVNLFRGEMMNKSLHFYLLAPMRREVLVAGKYIGGVIAALVIFCASTALQLWMFAIPYSGAATFESLHAASYIGVTALACLGYGSVFLAAGLLAVNPMIPAAGVLLWEAANLFLPSALKKISIIFYLQSLCPLVAPPEKDLNPLLALLISSAEPTPAALAITGLLAVTALILAWSALRARKLEINYSSD